MSVRSHSGEVPVEKKSAAEPIAFDVEGVVTALGGNISPELVRLEIKRGNIKSTRIGRRLLVTRTELLRYLDENARAE
jgi:hypothetical protein